MKVLAFETVDWVTMSEDVRCVPTARNSRTLKGNISNTQHLSQTILNQILSFLSFNTGNNTNNNIIISGIDLGSSLSIRIFNMGNTFSTSLCDNGILSTYIGRYEYGFEYGYVYFWRLFFFSQKTFDGSLWACAVGPRKLLSRRPLTVFVFAQFMTGRVGCGGAVEQEGEGEEAQAKTIGSTEGEQQYQNYLHEELVFIL